MIFEDATVHDHEDSGLTRFFGGAFVDHVFLQPDCRNFQMDGVLSTISSTKLRPAEDIDQVDLLRQFARQIEQRCIRLSPKASAICGFTGIIL